MNQQMNHAGTTRIRRHQLIGALMIAALGLFLFCLPVSASTNDVLFRFVQITDTHFGPQVHNRIASQAVERINNLPMPVACVVHTGDIASDNLDDGRTAVTATNVLLRLKAPLHTLPGNHDILRDRPATTAAAYTNTFGALCSQAEYQGVVFLMLYDEPLRKEQDPEATNTLAWLENALKAAGDKPVILFQHSPPVEDFYHNQIHPGWPKATRDQWEKLLLSHNVKAVICGHFHRDELFWIGRIPLLVGQPLAPYWGRQPSFRVFEYYDGRIGYRTVYIE